ncbi:13800_t:CDS:2, partial [Acaulospora morrowiae]
NLKKSVRGAAYLKRINFMQSVLSSSKTGDTLFGNILPTSEGINKRFRELSLFFHPDKTNQPNTPYWLNKNHKDLGAKQFQIILELWKISIDYRNASKGQWNKLKIIKVDDIRGFSSEELERLSIDYGMFAYNEYREACQFADKSGQLKKQVELRGNMALCLYVSKKLIEAQLYALSAIQLLLKSSEATVQDMISVRKIYNKVKGADETKESNDIGSGNNSNIELSCLKTERNSISIFEKKTHQRLNEEAIRKLSWNLIMPDQGLVSYYTSEKEITRAKTQTNWQYGKGMGWMLGSALNIGNNLASLSFIYFVGLSAAPISSPILLISFCLGIISSIVYWKKGRQLFNEAKIRTNLNRIMTNAIEAYNKGKYQKFIKILSEEYKEDTFILKLEKSDDIIDPKEIIKSLIKHGFRSDGIACLLNLLGLVLGSGRIEVNGLTTQELINMATTVFRGVQSEELLKEAKKLDERIRDSRKKFISKIFHFIYNEDDVNIDEEKPFQSRLEEMRNVALLNIAIIDILISGKEQIKRAIRTIMEIRNLITQDYKLYDVIKQRLEAVEDLLWIVSGEKPPEKLRITI